MLPFGQMFPHVAAALGYLHMQLLRLLVPYADGATHGSRTCVCPPLCLYMEWSGSFTPFMLIVEPPLHC